MVYTYVELKKRGLNNYQIKKMVEKKQLYKIKDGLYSKEREPSFLECMMKIHPNSIVTLNSAFHYYGLLRKESEFLYLATVQKARKIKEEQVKQIFMSDHLYKIGVVPMTYKGISFKTYSLERLLIELVRYKTDFEYETYQEIMNSYKRILKLLNKNKLEEYIQYFKDKKIKIRIEKELYGEKNDKK